MNFLWSKNVFGIPPAKFAEFMVVTNQQEEAVVRYWLLRDPLASWRRIIYLMDQWGASDIADRIRHHAEELIGMY